MTDTKHPYTFVYQTICEANNKSYIGVHTTSNLDDGYIGCGIFKPSDAHRSKLLLHRAVKKYGYASFKKHILSFYDTYKEALDEEKFIVNKLWVTDISNYNTALGGNGGMMYGLSKEQKDVIYKKISKANKGQKRSNEFCENLSKIKTGVSLSDTHKKSLSDNNARFWLGKKRPEISKKISVARKGKSLSEEHKKKLSEIKKGKYNNTGKSVCQYGLNNNFISEFRSVTEAAKSVGCLRTAISNNILGYTKTCANFIFKYKKK